MSPAQAKRQPVKRGRAQQHAHHSSSDLSEAPPAVSSPLTNPPSSPLRRRAAAYGSSDSESSDGDSAPDSPGWSPTTKAGKRIATQAAHSKPTPAAAKATAKVTPKAAPRATTSRPTSSRTSKSVKAATETSPHSVPSKRKTKAGSSQQAAIQPKSSIPSLLDFDNMFDKMRSEAARPTASQEITSPPPSQDIPEPSQATKRRRSTSTATPSKPRVRKVSQRKPPQLVVVGGSGSGGGSPGGEGGTDTPSLLSRLASRGKKATSLSIPSSPVASSSRMTIDMEDTDYSISSPPRRAPRCPALHSPATPDQEGDLFSIIESSMTIDRDPPLSSPLTLPPSQPPSARLPDGISKGDPCLFRSRDYYFVGEVAGYDSHTGNLQVATEDAGKVWKRKRRDLIFMDDAALATCPIGRLQNLGGDRPSARNGHANEPPAAAIDLDSITDATSFRSLEFREQLILLRPHLCKILTESYAPAQSRIDQFHKSSSDRAALSLQVRVGDLNEDDETEILRRLKQWACPVEKKVKADANGDGYKAPTSSATENGSPSHSHPPPSSGSSTTTDTTTRPTGSARYECLAPYLRVQFIEQVLLPEAIIAMCAFGNTTATSDAEMYTEAIAELDELARATDPKWHLLRVQFRNKQAQLQRKLAARQVAAPQSKMVEGPLARRAKLETDYRLLNGDAPKRPEDAVAGEGKPPAKRKRQARSRAGRDQAQAEDANGPQVPRAPMSSPSDEAMPSLPSSQLSEAPLVSSPAYMDPIADKAAVENGSEEAAAPAAATVDGARDGVSAASEPSAPLQTNDTDSDAFAAAAAAAAACYDAAPPAAAPASAGDDMIPTPRPNSAFSVGEMDAALVPTDADEQVRAAVFANGNGNGSGDHDMEPPAYE